MGLEIPVAALDRAFGVLSLPVPERARMVDAAGDVATRYIQRPFARSANPFGQPWAPLARAYDQRGLSGGQLVRTGALRDSFEGWRADGDSVVFGSNSPAYASFHQYGTDTIPARPFVPEGVLPVQWHADTEEALRGVLVRRVR